MSDYDANPFGIDWADIQETGDGRMSGVNRLYHPANAVTTQFPPMLETSESVAMVVYKESEIGLGLPSVMRSLKLDAALDIRTLGYTNSNGEPDEVRLPFSVSSL